MFAVFSTLQNDVTLTPKDSSGSTTTPTGSGVAKHSRKFNKNLDIINDKPLKIETLQKDS